MPTLQQQLAQLSRKLRKKIPAGVQVHVKRAMVKQAEAIVNTAKTLVPKGDTGNLEESIGWTFGDPPNTGRGGSRTLATVSSRGTNDVVITIFVGNDEAFYHRWQEFGTEHHAPNPYFFVSYRLHARRAKSAVKRAISKGIKEGTK